MPVIRIIVIFLKQMETLDIIQEIMNMQLEIFMKHIQWQHPIIM